MYCEYSQPCPIIVGCGAVSVLGEKIKEKGLKKPMLVFDPGVEAAGIPEKVGGLLKKAGLEYSVFNKVHADPSADVVDECAKLAMSEGVDCLVGLGGGSSMDTAKASSILLSGFEGPIRKYICQTPIPVATTTPVFLVPTTTGTGSECTTVAVISLPEKSVKWSVFVNTTLAIVDPELTVTLPQFYTASTGLDALAHAAEAMTVRDPNVHSDYMGAGAIRKIADNLINCYNNPTDIKSRTEMAIAANWAGLAFNNPITHVSHAMGDAFGCHFHMPHGHSCCIGLPETMRLVAPVRAETMKCIAEAMRLPVKGGESGEELGELVAQKITDMMRAMNITSLSGMGYSREQIVALAKDVTENHLSSYAPVDITLETAQKLLGAVYDNYR